MELSENQQKLLSLGPKFCPTPRRLDHDQLARDIDEGCRRLRLKELFYESDEEEETVAPKFYKPTRYRPPTGRNYALDDYCGTLVTRTQQYQPSRRPRDNLSQGHLYGGTVTRGNSVRTNSGTGIQWHKGTVARGTSGTGEQWNEGAVYGGTVYGETVYGGTVARRNSVRENSVRRNSGTGEQRTVKQWHGGTVYGGTVARGNSGTGEQWQGGTVARGNSGTGEQWHGVTVYRGTVARGNNGTGEQCTGEQWHGGTVYGGTVARGNSGTGEQCTGEQWQGGTVARENSDTG
ncbi:hypothetical protein ACOMHN_005938 [Nucella lapillus]